MVNTFVRRPSRKYRKRPTGKYAKKYRNIARRAKYRRSARAQSRQIQKISRGLGSLKEYVHGERNPLRFYRDLDIDFKHGTASGTTLKPFVAGAILSPVIQGPTSSGGLELTPYFGQEPYWQRDKVGFLHNISFDFLWDPSALSTDAPYFSNNYIFLVKVLNSTAAVAGAKERPAWGTTNSLMDANGSIDVSKLQENIHYTLGAGSRASCALNGEYFKVIRKFNLAYNQKSLDTNMLPGNTMLHWKVNQPMGNFQIKQSSQRLADMGAASGVNVAHWTNVDYFDIDTDRQYHLLYFTTNNSTTNPAPKLTIRVNYTYTSKET